MFVEITRGYFQEGFLFIICCVISTLPISLSFYVLTLFVRFAALHETCPNEKADFRTSMIQA